VEPQSKESCLDEEVKLDYNEDSSRVSFLILGFEINKGLESA